MGVKAVCLYRLEGQLEILQDVVDVLGANGQADGVRLDALVRQLLGGALAMCGGCRVDDQRFDIRHIGQQGEQL